MQKMQATEFQASIHPGYPTPPFTSAVLEAVVKIVSGCWFRSICFELYGSTPKTLRSRNEFSSDLNNSAAVFCD